MNHLEFAALESFESNKGRAWAKFHDDAAKLLGVPDLDSPDFDRDMFCMDYAHDAFVSGYTAKEYVEDVLDKRMQKSGERSGLGVTVSFEG